MKLASSKEYYEKVGDEVYRLREEKQQLQLENAGRNEIKKRIADMNDFLLEQSTILSEYDESLVRRLIEKVTVYEDSFAVEFKSSISISLDS